jgi:outer membrane protein assembly factor BamB
MPSTTRRGLLAGLAGGTTAALAGCTRFLGSSSDGPRWPQFRADAGNTGTSTAASIPTDPIEQDWQTALTQRGPLSAEAGYQQLVGTDTVYASSFEETDDEHVTAFRLAALDPSDGSERWATTVPELTRRLTGIHAIAMDDERVYPSGLQRAAAVDRASGDVAWTTDDGVPLMGPTVADDTLYATTVRADRRMTHVAVDAATGEREWATDTGRIGPLAVTDDHLVVHGSPSGEVDPAVVAWRQSDGEPAWRVDDVPENGQGTVLATDDTVVATRVRPDRPTWVGAFDAATGEERWTATLDGRTAWPVLARDTVYVGRTDSRGNDAGEVVGLALHDGSERLRFDAAYSGWGGELLSDGERLLTVNEETGVYDLEDGSEVWRAEVEGFGALGTAQASLGVDAVFPPSDIDGATCYR